MSREYPDYPRVGVGAVVLHAGRVLLVKRGRPPGLGRWSLPGGLVELGETTAEAARREVAEECGIAVQVAGVAGVVDRVIRDDRGRIQYHYVLVDYLAYAESEAICAGTDAADVRWVPADELQALDVTEGLRDMIERAMAMANGGNS